MPSPPILGNIRQLGRRGLPRAHRDSVLLHPLWHGSGRQEGWGRCALVALTSGPAAA